MGNLLKTYPHVVTSPYGQRSSGWHGGIDLVGNNGSYNVLDYVCAKDKGVVVNVRKDCQGFEGNGSYGNFIHIDHLNGYSTVYAHLSPNEVYVNVGETVEEGQVIGYMGNTGHSYGGHLHFEVRYGNEKIDPTDYAINGKDIIEKNIVNEPVEENKNVNQIYITCNDTMRCRTTPEIKDDNCIGFFKIGYYNVIEEITTDYHWCKLAENNWVACLDGYANYIPIEIKQETPQIKEEEENNTNTPVDTETSENKQENSENDIYIQDKEDVLLWLLEIIAKFIRKLFKKN